MTDTTSLTNGWFYTDPLAAAWMSDKFGMKFVGQSQSYAVPFCHHFIEEDKMNGRPDKYYIHDDSLHLLEPVVGDMITHLGMRAWRIDGIDDKMFTHPPIGPESISRFTLKSDNPKIIQRNGIAFMCPQQVPSEYSEVEK